MPKSPPHPPRANPLLRAIPGPIAGLFLLGLPNTWMPPGAELETCTLLTPPLAHCWIDALCAEQAYLEQVVDFQEPTAPNLPTLRPRDIAVLGAIWSVKRVFCAVVCDASGTIAASRDYGSLDHAHVITAQDILDRQIASLKQRIA